MTLKKSGCVIVKKSKMILIGVSSTRTRGINPWTITVLASLNVELDLSMLKAGQTTRTNSGLKGDAEVNLTCWVLQVPNGIKCILHKWMALVCFADTCRLSRQQFLNCWVFTWANLLGSTSFGLGRFGLCTIWSSATLLVSVVLVYQMHSCVVTPPCSSVL